MAGDITKIVNSKELTQLDYIKENTLYLPVYFLKHILVM